MGLTIRRAIAEDYSSLCVLFDEGDALHREILPHIFQKPDGPARDYDYYFGLITDKLVGFFVMETDRKLVGFVHTVIRDAPEFPIFTPRRYAIIESIGVAASWRNQGVGRRLMDTAQEWAITQGATRIELNVYEFNQKALRFYRQLGYEVLSMKMDKPLKRA